MKKTLETIKRLSEMHLIDKEEQRQAYLRILDTYKMELANQDLDDTAKDGDTGKSDKDAL